MELHLAWIRNEGDGFDLIAVDCPDGGTWSADQDLEYQEAGYSGTAKWLTITVPEEQVAALFAGGDDEDE